LFRTSWKSRVANSPYEFPLVEIFAGEHSQSGSGYCGLREIEKARVAVVVMIHRRRRRRED